MWAFEEFPCILTRKFPKPHTSIKVLGVIDLKNTMGEPISKLFVYQKEIPLVLYKKVSYYPIEILPMDEFEKEFASYVRYEPTNDIFCLDCGKLLEQPIVGIVVEAWLRTDGKKDLGFVCDECSIENKNRIKEKENANSSRP